MRRIYKPSAPRGSDPLLLHGWTSPSIFSECLYGDSSSSVVVSFLLKLNHLCLLLWWPGVPLCTLRHYHHVLPSTNRSRHGTVFEIKGTSSWSKLLICHLFCLPLSLGSWPRWHFCLVACPAPAREQNFSFLNMDARAHSGCCSAE